MNLRDGIVSGLGLVKEQAKAAVVSTVWLAKQADLRKLAEVNTKGLTTGIDLVGRQAKAAVVSTVSLAKQADLRKLAEVNTSGGAVAAAAVVTVGAIGTYFLWPVAAPAAATMKAPGAAGFVISRAAFLANPQLYFHLLRTAGAKAAAAAFAAL